MPTLWLPGDAEDPVPRKPRPEMTEGDRLVLQATAWVGIAARAADCDPEGNREVVLGHVVKVRGLLKQAAMQGAASRVGTVEESVKGILETIGGDTNDGERVAFAQKHLEEARRLAGGPELERPLAAVEIGYARDLLTDVVSQECADDVRNLLQALREVEVTTKP